MISECIATILRQDGVAPRNVVAFTFTENAAAELKKRVLGMVWDDFVGLAEMYIGTIHGYCLDLLQRLVPDTFKFSVLTDVTARLLVDKYTRQSGPTTCPTTGNAAQPFLKRWHNAQVYLQVMSVLRDDTIKGRSSVWGERVARVLPKTAVRQG